MLETESPRKGVILSHTLGKPEIVELKKAIRKRLFDSIEDSKERERLLDLLEDFARTPFGASVLQNRGFSGYWSDFIVRYPYEIKEKGVHDDGRALSDFERQMFETFPSLIATQNRHQIFMEVIKKHCIDGAVIGSVPCGLMTELVAQRFETKDIKLMGFDLDAKVMERAKAYAQKMGKLPYCEFVCADAWHLPIENELTLLVSNGLNVYVREEEQLLGLYASFYKALRPGGSLLTSYMPYPKRGNEECEWDLEVIDKKALRLQRDLFITLAQANFAYYRSYAETKSQLEKVGFTDVKVIYDKFKMFPAITAIKPLAS